MPIQIQGVMTERDNEVDVGMLIVFGFISSTAHQSQTHGSIPCTVLEAYEEETE
jgi:hypothetical protein